jgi:hypothetical protein
LLQSRGVDHRTAHAPIVLQRDARSRSFGPIDSCRKSSSVFTGR